MSGLILSGCDFSDKNSLTKKQVIELKQYCIRSNADTYRLDNGNFFRETATTTVRRVVCIYIDEEADARYEVDALEIKKREESENGN